MATTGFWPVKGSLKVVIDYADNPDKTTNCRSLDELPLVISVEDLMPILNIGRNTAYELVRSGKIRSTHVGRKIRVPKEAIAEYLSQ